MNSKMDSKFEKIEIFPKSIQNLKNKIFQKIKISKESAEKKIQILKINPTFENNELFQKKGGGCCHSWGDGGFLLFRGL